MSENTFKTFETAWCPGCGNFNILECLKTALYELGKDPYEVLMVAGIGQAAKTPQYIGTNGFCGLHGRALPAAIAAKIANEKLTVIVESGDGDSYGEGGNHFIHNIRRNVDIAHFVHDNQIYGLTKGQASPTTSEGQVTGVQTSGNITPPLNPVLLAIAAGAGFVARAFSGNKAHLVAMMKQAIEYKGYALVDIFQPCVTFNKVNTHAWYKEMVYELEEDYNPGDKMAAMQRAMELAEKIPIGVLYREEKPTFHQKNKVLAAGGPLLDREADSGVLESLI
ncbi:MAG TPA: 2-oxoacid:ferredoxin oxidoreductase subunit beta, partial [Clostridia bacterium]|nr:2-oxoacid:ferredoxin oxidoreductase subunit beta [Clostridia bacterium]